VYVLWCVGMIGASSSVQRVIIAAVSGFVVALAACTKSGAPNAAPVAGMAAVLAPNPPALPISDGGAAGKPAAASGGTGGSAPMNPQVGRASTGSGTLPCDVADVLKRRCQSCHAAMPVAGVPMALVTSEDLSTPAVHRPDLSVAQYAALRVHDAKSPMPPDKPLPSDELALLDAWFQRGAPRGTDLSCAAAPNQEDGGVKQPAGPPPDSTCYTLKAHGKPMAGDTSPWVVSNQHYACFYFDAPWPDGAQGVYFAPVFDGNPSQVHHFLLYLDQNGNQANGYVETCTGLHASGPTMVAGWAPGSDNNALPPDVGLDLSPPNHKLLLEIHFFHDGVSAPTPTTSGIQVCTSNKTLTNTATISLLGTEAIALPAHAKASVSGNCNPQYNGEIHVLRSWPHMHQMGTGMQTVVHRADGSMQTLGPWPFDFNAQVSYSTPLILKPGDHLTTTCDYENTSDAVVATGTDTKSEMCFNFVTAYPAGALMSKNILGGSTSATSSATACLQ
jgi:hypothetical protein